MTWEKRDSGYMRGLWHAGRYIVHFLISRPGAQSKGNHRVVYDTPFEMP